MLKHALDQRRIKDMLVQAPVFEVLQAALPEMLCVTRERISGQIMESQYLFQVRQIVFLGLVLVVVEQVFK